MKGKTEIPSKSSAPKKDEAKRDDIEDVPDSILSQTLFP